MGAGKKNQRQIQAFRLEPLRTPSGLIDSWEEISEDFSLTPETGDFIDSDLEIAEIPFIENDPLIPAENSDPLETALSLATEQLATFSQKPELLNQISQIFGSDIEPEQVLPWLESWSQSEKLPTITVVSGDTLGAVAGFAAQTQTIYISQEFLNAHAENPAPIAQVLIEELGHYLDSQLNCEDTPGDEGALFAALVTSEEMSSSFNPETENDTFTTTINNQTLEIERSGSTGTGLRAEYFNNADLTDPVLTRTDATIDFDWDTNPPDPALQANTWSARWRGQIEPLYSETYTFYTTADDGMRLWVNGELVIDSWEDGSTDSYTRYGQGSITLEAGQLYDIKAEYRDQWWVAKAKLEWESTTQVKQVIPSAQLYPWEPPPPPPPGTGTGLRAEYFHNIDLSDPAFERVDANIAFDWDTNAPDSSMEADTWSVRWTGEIEPFFSETYTFRTTADDGIRVWINGELVINAWDDGSTNSYTRNGSGTITLEAGQRYDIKVEYYDRWWKANAKLLWESESQPLVEIPSTQLYPATPPPPPPLEASSGYFIVGDSGQVSFDFLYDGGAYQGEVAIFSLEGMGIYEPGSTDFIAEAASRALSSSTLGHIIISDSIEGAKFTGNLPEGNFNSGPYQGVKTYSMNPGDQFGVMLVPSGTIQQLYD